MINESTAHRHYRKVRSRKFPEKVKTSKGFKRWYLGIARTQIAKESVKIPLAIGMMTLIAIIISKY